MNIFHPIRELLTESVKFSEVLEGQAKQLYIEGITLQADVKNKNGRTYPKHVLSEAIAKHMEMMDSGGAVGELNHPTTHISEINPDRISHRFTNITESGSNFTTKALVLGTTCGQQVKSLLEGGVRLGISSRALGSIKESNGNKVVSAMHLVSFGDIVTNPSAPNAFIQGVMESSTWVLEAGHLVEKGIEEYVDGYRMIIEKTNIRDRDVVFKNLFKDYLNKIKVGTI